MIKRINDKDWFISQVHTATRGNGKWFYCELLCIETGVAYRCQMKYGGKELAILKWSGRVKNTPADMIIKGDIVHSFIQHFGLNFSDAYAIG